MTALVFLGHKYFRRSSFSRDISMLAPEVSVFLDDLRGSSNDKRVGSVQYTLVFVWIVEA